MTTDLSALRVAIDLLHAPSRVRVARSRPLPGGIVFLLQVAAGEAEAELEAVEASGRPADVVREAAMFFVEQVLFGSESDSYRMLGAERQASTAELRRNMALLLRSFHPDIERDRVGSMSVSKVTQAWDDLKTPDRRASYDRALAGAEAGKSEMTRTREKKRSKRRCSGDQALEPAIVKRSRWRQHSFGRRTTESPGAFARAILFLLGRGGRRGWPRS